MKTPIDCIITCSGIGTLSLSGDEFKEFQTLLRRGAECWPDASPNIKALVDLVTHGALMQNYWAQAGVVAPDPMPPIFGEKK